MSEEASKNPWCLVRCYRVRRVREVVVGFSGRKGLFSPRTKTPQSDNNEKKEKEAARPADQAAASGSSAAAATPALPGGASSAPGFRMSGRPRTTSFAEGNKPPANPPLGGMKISSEVTLDAAAAGAGAGAGTAVATAGTIALKRNKCFPRGYSPSVDGYYSQAIRPLKLFQRLFPSSRIPRE
uniref:Uncharacterized protein n=1 Tax=Vespula pensylvanica TaxID=30213 RepID=A0A834JSE1_VESPE|nr:hypothetical protein H0235_017853 [Vespula pensylvanica]